MAWWPLGRNRQKPAAGLPRTTPPLIGSVEHDGAWRDLPALQRTLADSLQPVAINNDFRDSLASYADPSFVAPLAHQVEPEAGGLVDGLVSPGTPYPHPSGPELAVPPRPDPPASSRPAAPTRSGPIDAAPVQRSATSNIGADLSTVALELPGIASPMPDTQPSPAKDSVPTVPTEVVSLPRTGSATEPASVKENPALDHGSEVALTATTSRELPVVARSVDPAADPRPTSQTSDTAAARPVRESGPFLGTRDLPVVNRSAEPTAEVEVPTGISGTVASNDHLVTGDDHASETHDHSVHDDDHSLQSASSPVSPPIQRVATDDQMLGGGEAELPVVVPSHPAMAADSPLPVVSRGTDTGGDSAMKSKQREIEARSDAPTLGVRIERTSLTLQRTPMTDRVSAPDEPAVQRVEFITQQFAPGHRTGPAPHTPSPARPPAPTAPGISATAAVPLPTAQRLPSHDGKQVSNSLTGHPLAVLGREMQVRDLSKETQMRPESPVQRRESFERSAPGPAASPLERNLHSETRVESVTPEIGDIGEDKALAPPATAPTAGELRQRPAAPEVPMGPAVIPERLITVAPTPTSRPTAAGHSPLPTVSRLAAEAPIHPTPRPPVPSPTLVVGQPVLQARADTASSDSRPGGAMSFASMFRSEAASETGSPAQDGITSVQLQVADDSDPAASEPTDTSSTPPIATAAPSPVAPGGKPADLDELARRLYEPLTARLRAELWLDRERAGVMSNG